MPRIFLIPATVCLCVALSACGGNVRESLGLKKKAPDEFMVLARPPLSLPPDYNLSPPAMEGGAAEESQTKEAARKTVLGGKKPQGGKTPASAGENALLKQAGAGKARSDIRKVLDEESGQVSEEEGEDSGSLMETLQPEKKEPIVDADAEKKRLQKNREKNKPVTEGETPTITPEGKSPLRKIIGD